MKQQAQPTEQASHALRYARVAASEMGAAMVEPEHLLLGILHDEHSDARMALYEREIPQDAICRELKTMLSAAAMQRADNNPPVPLEAIPLSVASKAVLRYAAYVAHQHRNTFVGPRHILAALFALPSPCLAALWEKNGISAAENNAALETLPDNVLPEEWQEGDTTPTTTTDTKGLWARFSPKARKAVWLAQEEAGRAKSNIVFTQYLLAGVLQQEQTIVSETLRRCGVERGTLRAALVDILDSGQMPGDMQLHPASKKVIDTAYAYSKNFEDDYVVTEHLFLGLLSDTGKTGKLLRDHGVTTAGFLAQLRTVRRNGNIEEMKPEPIGGKVIVWVTLVAALLGLLLLRGC